MGRLSISVLAPAGLISIGAAPSLYGPEDGIEVEVYALFIEK